MAVRPLDHPALTVTIVAVLIVVATVTLLGREAKGIEFGRAPAEARATTGYRPRVSR